MLEGGTSIIDGVAVAQILQEELATLRSQITANIRNTGQWASGKTAASMQITVNGTEGTLAGRRAFHVLETGRPPGRIPGNMHHIIYDWMQAKGVHGDPIPYVRGGDHKYTPQQRGDKQMAWHISQKIKEEGTSLFRNGGREDVYSPIVADTAKRVNARLATLMQAKIADIIQINIRREQ